LTTDETFVNTPSKHWAKQQRHKAHNEFHWTTKHAGKEAKWDQLKTQFTSNIGADFPYLFHVYEQQNAKKGTCTEGTCGSKALRNISKGIAS
jgi:hypothetical protein